MSITFQDVPANATASGVFVEQQAVRRTATPGTIPQKLLLIGQPSADVTPDYNVIQRVFSVGQANQRYGAGSLLASMVETALARSGGVEVYCVALEEAGESVQATPTFEVTDAATSDGTFYVYIGGHRVPVTVANEDTVGDIADAIVSAVNARVILPVTAESTAGLVTFTVKWAGETGNQVKVEVNILEGDSDTRPSGFDYTITQATNGADDPDITPALDALGEEHITVIANPYLGSDALDALKAKADEYADPIEKKVFLIACGYNGDHDDFFTLLDDHNSQFLSFLPVPLSASPEYEIAASYGANLARNANVDPAVPPRTLPLIGIRGAREYWSYNMRNAVVMDGGSTTLTGSDRLPLIEGAVTTRTEDALGNPESAWRFVETVFNIQTKMYQLDVIFGSEPFVRATVVDDNSTTNKRTAIRPRTVKAFAIQAVDNWINKGWSKERDSIVEGIVAEIDSDNPGRINLLIPDVIAAGLKIMAVKYEWAFQPASA